MKRTRKIRLAGYLFYRPRWTGFFNFGWFSVVYSIPRMPGFVWRWAQRTRDARLDRREGLR